jgi:glycosyltransferase involved in cell wall biosynthesis
MNKFPLVSIIIPTFNAEEFLQDAIDSILEQSYKNYEVIFVDDCSTDSTVELEKEYVKSYSNFKLLKAETNGGPGKARNFGLKQAQGEYVAFLDHDDVWVSTKLEKQVEILNQNKSVGAVYCFTEFLNSKEACEYTVAFNGCIWKNLLLNTITVPSAIMIRTDLLKKVGGFHEVCRVSEDWHTWLKLSMETNFKCIEEPLNLRRSHKNQITNPSKNKRQFEFDRLALKDFFRLYGNRVPLINKLEAWSRLFSINAHNARSYSFINSTKLYLIAMILYPLNAQNLKSVIANFLKWKQVSTQAKSCYNLI